jgi:hypothetical protein
MVLVVYSLLVLFDLIIQTRNYMEFNRMNDQQFQVSSMLNVLLVNSLAEPGERLTRSVCNDIGAEVATWVRDYPDVIGVHTIVGKNITNYLTRATSPVYQKIMEQNALSMLDTLHFYNCVWDSTCQLAHQWINIEDFRLLCSFFRTPTQIFLVVRDTEKLKKGLSKILDDCRRQMYPFDYYFRPHEPFGAQIKFFDEGYNNFLTYGNPTGKGWERIQEVKVPFLPWKRKVQIFDQHEPPIVSSVEKLTWWLAVIMVAIGVLCVLWLGWLGRGYAWEVKKEGDEK